MNPAAATIDGDEQDLLEALTSFVLTNEGASGLWDITASLVDDANLQHLHSQFLGSDTPTDVMTFPFDERGGAIQGGDIVISIDHARTRAAEWGLTPAEEVRFLVVHGLLHLLSWRDETDEQRQHMLQRQQALIDQFLQR